MFNISSVGNLKSAQWRKLFITLQSSLMQNLGIFEAKYGIHFDFTIFNQFG
jgi:hypothetical protein